MKNIFHSLTSFRPGRALAAIALVLLAAGAAQAQTTTNFAYTGGTQTYTVPAGVTQLQVRATGASGGYAQLRAGTQSYGGVVQAVVTVVPGETLTVVVGGGAANGFGTTGGYNGGVPATLLAAGAVPPTCGARVRAPTTT